MLILTGKEIIGVRDLLDSVQGEISKLIVNGEVKNPESMGAIEHTRVELLKIHEMLGECYLGLRQSRVMPNECEDGA